MLQDQLQKYENLRRKILGNPDQARVTSKKERMEEPPHISLNFPVDSSFWDRIMNLVGELEKEDPGHEYIYPPILHCTVKSCGVLGKNISEDTIPEIIPRIDKALKDFKAFEITLRGLNTFTTNTFIQVFSEDSRLFDLHNLLNDTVPYGEPEFERENYTPHVTIIYYYHRPDKLFTALGRHKDILVGKMKVDKVNFIIGTPSLFIQRMKVIKTFWLK